MRTTVTALESYRVDTNHYPPCDYVVYPANPADVTSGGNGAAPVNPPILRLIPLTTPIAYITSISQDVFNIEGKNWGPPLNGTVLFYWGGPWLDLVSTSATTDATLFAEIPQNIDQKNNFVLLSYSPDKDFDALDTGWPSTIQIYDPTNGIRSFGDIIRLSDRQVDW